MLQTGFNVLMVGIVTAALIYGAIRAAGVVVK